MKRALLVLLGLVLIAVAAWVLLRTDLPPLRSSSPRQGGAPAHVESEPAQVAPSDENAAQAQPTPGSVEPNIDAASRAKLEAVLLEHEENGIGPESKAKLKAVLPSEGGTNSSENPR